MVNHKRDERGERVRGVSAREKIRNAEFIDTLKRAFVRHNKHVVAHPTRPSITRVREASERVSERSRDAH